MPRGRSPASRVFLPLPVSTRTGRAPAAAAADAPVESLDALAYPDVALDHPVDRAAVEHLVGAGEQRAAVTERRTTDNRDDIVRLQAQWQPLAQIMERIDERLNRHQELITKTATLLDTIANRMDRNEREHERFVEKA